MSSSSSSPESPGPVAPRLAPLPFERHDGADFSPSSPVSPASLSFDLAFMDNDHQAAAAAAAAASSSSSSVEEPLPPSADISDASSLAASAPPPPPLSPVASLNRGSDRRVRMAEPEPVPDLECAYLEVEEDDGDDEPRAASGQPEAARASSPKKAAIGGAGGGAAASGARAAAPATSAARRPARTCLVLPAAPTAAASLVLAMMIKILVATTYAGFVSPVDKEMNGFKQGDVAAIMAVVIGNVLFAVCYLVGFMAVSKRLVMSVKAVLLVLGLDTLLTPAQHFMRIVSINRAIAAEARDADDSDDFTHVALLRGKASASYMILAASLAFNLFFMYALFRYLRTVRGTPASANKKEEDARTAPAAGGAPQKTVAVSVA